MVIYSNIITCYFLPQKSVLTVICHLFFQAQDANTWTLAVLFCIGFPINLFSMCLLLRKMFNFGGGSGGGNDKSTATVTRSNTLLTHQAMRTNSATTNLNRIPLPPTIDLSPSEPTGKTCCFTWNIANQ